jgi:hypothetical protein
MCTHAACAGDNDGASRFRDRCRCLLADSPVFRYREMSPESSGRSDSNSIQRRPEVTRSDSRSRDDTPLFQTIRRHARRNSSRDRQAGGYRSRGLSERLNQTRECSSNDIPALLSGRQADCLRIARPGADGSVPGGPSFARNGERCVLMLVFVMEFREGCHEASNTAQLCRDRRRRRVRGER